MVLVWFLAGLGLFLLEIFVPTCVTLFFGVGAWAAMIGTLAGLDFPIQIAVFIVVSLLALFVLRGYARQIFSGSRTPGREESAHPMAGQLAEVTVAIRPGQVGEVSAGGSFWRATSREELPVGTSARVTGHADGDELVLQVDRVVSD